MNKQRASSDWLFIGDILVILLVTWIGFWTHNESVLNPRWLTTFLPVVIGWLAISPWLGLYRPEVFCSWKQIWRVALAAVLSAPLAAWLRGAVLNSAILPLFVLVMAATNAFGLMLWRLLWTVIENRVARHG